MGFSRHLTCLTLPAFPAAVIWIGILPLEKTFRPRLQTLNLPNFKISDFYGSFAGPHSRRIFEKNQETRRLFMKRLFVHPVLCTGCKTCEIACAVEHSRSKNLIGAMMESPPPQSRIYVEAVMRSPFEVFKMPMTCRHCDPAPCISACIPQAMHYTGGGTVTNVGGKHACIACSMCIMTCPFGMITRGKSPEGQVMALKCDLCPERDIPACAAACPTGAIVFLESPQFAHHTRIQASAMLADAQSGRQATMTKALEE